MTAVDKMIELLNAKGVSPTKMMKDLGFSTGLFTHWKKGLQQPSFSKLCAISEYLGVPINEFTDVASPVEPEISKSGCIQIHEDENQIHISVNREMIPDVIKDKGPESRRIISSILDDLADMEEDELKRAKKVIEALK